MQIVKWGGALDNRFTSNKWHHKLRRLQNRDKYRRIGIIGITIFVVFISIIYFTYSKFTSSGRFTIVDTTVKEFGQYDYVIASYINGEYSNSIPTKEVALSNNLTVSEVKCDNGAIGTWDNDKWAITIENATKKTKCNIYFYFGVEISYTGSETKFIVPYNGKYRLEVWGAQGGNSNGSLVGGYGAYSKGDIYLKKDDILYVNVGGKGDNERLNYANGGYNGGGNAAIPAGYNEYVSGGGGATHVAIKSGLLSNFEKYRNDILIVAGGGGGSFVYNLTSQGGNGGGFVGTSGTNSRGPSTGGNQNAGGNGYSTGSFGKGGNGNSWSSAGGGGYYGGGGGCGTAGGGGSGYIGNQLLTNKVMYCYYCKESAEENTKTISTTNVSSKAISNYAKIGNGSVKITLIELLDEK